MKCSNTHLLSGDGLFGGLQQLIDHLLGLEGDEAESLPLVLCLVEGHLNLHNLLTKSDYILEKESFVYVF